MPYDFQVSYTSGGAAVAFTDNGTPPNSYDLAYLDEGSEFTLPVTNANPRTIIVKSNLPMVTGEKVAIFIMNDDDAVDIDVNSAYFRA